MRQQLLARQGMVRLSDLPASPPPVPPVIVLPPYEPPTDELQIRLHAFLDEKLSDENLTVKQVAAAMYLGKSQMVRTIKKKTGFTTEQYILRHRLHRALHLLLTTQTSIGEIAGHVGFKSVAHFSNAFKREFGVSPSEIRRARDNDHTAT